MTGGAVPPIPEWLQELPTLNTESPSIGNYVLLGVYDGVLNPIITINIQGGVWRLGFAGPAASRVWTLDEHYRYKVVSSNVLVQAPAAQEIIDTYDIQQVQAYTRQQVTTMVDASDLKGKLILNE